nr:substrate-binding domain-containing protein [Vibrio agarilyticus]
MVVSTLAGPFFSSLMSSIEETLRHENYYLIPTSGRYQRQDELEAVDFLLSKQVDGLILHAGMLSDDDILSIVKQVPHTLVLNHLVPEISEHCIFLDEEMGGYIATQHLIDAGHRVIGCITGPMHENVSQARLKGYQQALLDNGLDYDANLIVEGQFDFRNVRQAPSQLLDRNTNLTAVFCFNDHIALGLYEEIKSRQLVVGKDISVVGYDNDKFGEFISPPLTSVNFPTREMGGLAAKKILALINQRVLTIENRMSPQLIQRQSVT